MGESSQTINVAGVEFTISVEVVEAFQPVVHVYVEAIDDVEDTCLLRCVIEAPAHGSFSLRSLAVAWSVPITDMHGLYFGGIPRNELAYLPFWEFSRPVCANTGVPYLSLIHRSGENRFAVGAFDQITETGLKATLSEVTRCYHFRLQKPANSGSVGQTIHIADRWEEVLFISTARRSWPGVLETYVRLIDKMSQQPCMPVPEHAFDPVFCTWTAIHHDVSHDWVLRNARIAADLGFRTWITDDGWFIDKGQFADYSRVGDWLPCEAKFPNFKDHVSAIQGLGFRYVLWVAPFMVGEASEAARQYRHLLTTGQRRERFNNLSPWHGETREIVVSLLARLVENYHLDGLKIDFIDAISVHSERPKGANSATLGESIYEILRSAAEQLLALNPGLLIEFRNSYANLASRRYANVFRSGDVPLNFTLNRWQAVMLRLLAPDRAVHLDPAIWHPADSDEDVAVHLINIIASVPMVSIELDKYPQSHLDLIRYWIGFYQEHRDTIVHGEFKPVLRPGYIPAIHFVGGDEAIIGLYDDLPVSLDNEKPAIWLLNASNRPYVDLLPGDLDGVRAMVLAHDKFGRRGVAQSICLPVSRLDVEVGGSLEIRF